MLYSCLTTRLRRSLQYYILFTSRIGARSIWMGVYTLCVRVLTYAISMQKSVKTIYLTRSISDPVDFIPGLSDIDLQIILHTSDKAHKRSLRTYLSWLKRLCPLLDAQISAYTDEEFIHNSEKHPYHIYRACEGKHKWKRLYGPNILESVTESRITDDQLFSELQEWIAYYVNDIFHNTEHTTAIFEMNSRCFRVVAELGRIWLKLSDDSHKFISKTAAIDKCARELDDHFLRTYCEETINMRRAYFLAKEDTYRERIRPFFNRMTCKILSRLEHRHSADLEMSPVRIATEDTLGNDEVASIQKDVSGRLGVLITGMGRLLEFPHDHLVIVLENAAVEVLRPESVNSIKSIVQMATSTTPDKQHIYVSYPYGFLAFEPQDKYRAYLSCLRLSEFPEGGALHIQAGLRITTCMRRLNAIHVSLYFRELADVLLHPAIFKIDSGPLSLAFWKVIQLFYLIDHYNMESCLRFCFNCSELNRYAARIGIPAGSRAQLYEHFYSSAPVRWDINQKELVNTLRVYMQI